MLAIIVCLAAFLITARAGIQSLGHGIVSLLVFGYTYGIVRANLPTTASHFIFDAAVLGLYASQKWTLNRAENKRQSDIQTWVMALMSWPFVVCLFPFQPFWVTMVGLRGNIFLLPLILLGCRLEDKDIRLIAKGVACLNLLALTFGILEYFMGIQSFYPVNDVTRIIYASADVAGGQYRIPSIFVTAHGYGGAMFMSIGWLFGAFSLTDRRDRWRFLYLLGLLASFAGVLLSATRTNFIIASILILVATFKSKVSFKTRLAWMAALCVIGLFAVNNERLQRFTTLADQGTVSTRVEGSVNSSFWELLSKYPMGNGLGGGGTSMPYFLEGQVKNPVGLESEYARILCEQGVIGLMLWICFVAWHLQHRSAFQKTPWLEGRRLAWCTCTCCFVLGMVGPGMLTAIPSTAFLLLMLGWIATPMRVSQFNPIARNPELPANRAHLTTVGASTY